MHVCSLFITARHALQCSQRQEGRSNDELLSLPLLTAQFGRRNISRGGCREVLRLPLVGSKPGSCPSWAVQGAHRELKKSLAWGCCRVHPQLCTGEQRSQAAAGWQGKIPVSVNHAPTDRMRTWDVLRWPQRCSAGRTQEEAGSAASLQSPAHPPWLSG